MYFVKCKNGKNYCVYVLLYQLIYIIILFSVVVREGCTLQPLMPTPKFTTDTVHEYIDICLTKLNMNYCHTDFQSVYKHIILYDMLKTLLANVKAIVANISNIAMQRTHRDYVITIN